MTAENKGSAVTKVYDKIEPQASCRSCGVGVPINLESLHRYLRGEEDLCPHCKAPTDWLEMFSHTANFSLGTFAVVGAKGTIFELTIAPNDVVKVDFTALIGPDIRVLDINYSMRSPGSVIPLELHGNSPRHGPTSTVLLYGRPTGRGEAGEPGMGNIFVTWTDSDDETWLSLVSAFEAMHSGRLNSAIVPANVTVEIAVTLFIDRFLKEHVAASAVNDFIEGGHRVPYGHRLSVLLPFIASIMGAPAIPTKVATNLKKLKNYRNDIAHQGKPRDKLDRQAVADLLAAVALGVVYVDLLEATAFPPEA